MAGRVTTLWVKHPLSVNQHGQLSQPSLRGRLNESSNPLMMDYEGGDLLLAGAACAGCWVTAQDCVCRLGGDLNNGLAAQFQ